MRLKLLSCLIALVLLVGCGQNTPEKPANDTVVPRETTNQDAVPQQEKEPEYENLTAPFIGIRDNEQVAIKERSSFYEIKLTCTDLDISTRPDGWETLCSDLEAAGAESQSVSEAEYNAKTVAFQLQDGAGEILCSGYGSEIKYNAFSEPDLSVKSNAATITLTEYNKISIGMTYSECVEIIGGEGTLDIEVGSAGGAIGSFRNYTWKGTTEYGTATMSFDDYVLYSKFQVGLE